MLSGLFRHVSPLKLFSWLKGSNILKDTGWWRIALRVLPALGNVIASLLSLGKRLFARIPRLGTR